MNRNILINILYISLLLSSISLTAQIDSVNTKTNKLKSNQLKEGTHTYVVYLQDSIDGVKYNFEIWDRKLTQNKENNTYKLNWVRHKNSKNESYAYEIIFDDTFKTLTEKVIHKKKVGDTIQNKHKFFIYDNNTMFSSENSSQHNTSPVKIDDLKHSINWELDIETLSGLPMSDDRKFAICFYHPGSKTPPKYYNYNVERTEILALNGTEYDCWVLKVVYAKNQSCEFWIDKKTNNVMLSKDTIYGRFRFKRLVI